MISFDEFIKQDDEEKYNNMQHDLLEIEILNNRIEKAKHFIDQVLGYHLSSGYEQLDKDVNELYGILKGEDKE